ncbi:MAG: universal stress protein [Tenuifilum sp.]|uniref:universal stress protein n=1 Tax=Tenuifilum sp. TaxID=2760880 RepID=UPI0030B51581
MFKHAILGTDLSKASSTLIESSDEFSRIGIEKITLIHVIDLRNTKLLGSFTLETIEESLTNQKTILEGKGFDVNAEIIYGIPSIEIEKKRKEVSADLIIVGSNGSNWSGTVLGENASEILHNIKSPVLLIVLKQTKSLDEILSNTSFFKFEQLVKHWQTFEPDWELYCKNITEHVLFPTDFSNFSEHAFECLMEQPFKINRLTLMHVQDEVKIGPHLESKLGEFNKIDGERLHRLSQAFKQKHPETEVSIKLVYGKLKNEIVKAIQTDKVTLTVMGSQGRGYLSEIFLGSVSHHVARHADSHVLLIPLIC